MEKVKAKKKACWIHTDYANVGVDPALELRIWDGYDHIVSISDDVTSSFLKAFPSLEKKIVVMKNILPEDFVRARTKEGNPEEVEAQMPRKEGTVNLLSVGRFCYAKNYDNVPDICKRILSKGVNVCWYLIGYGSDEQLIKDKIKEAGLSENVVILGKKANSYPYIQACDIYVQPSRFEGNSVTVREAQMLGRPVVITDYPTASSQVENGVDGIIIPMDNEACAQGIVDFIRNEEKRTEIKENIKTRDFSNRNQIDVIDKLFE